MAKTTKVKKDLNQFRLMSYHETNGALSHGNYRALIWEISFSTQNLYLLKCLF